MSILGVGEAVGGIAQGVGQAAQGAGMVVSKLGDLLMSPLNLICDWARKPIKRAENKRIEDGKDNEIKRRIELEIGKDVALSKQRMNEERFQSQLRTEELKAHTEINIKRETEVVRIIMEIEQLKKDRELERMKAVSDAMMRYQKELTRVNKFSATS